MPFTDGIALAASLTAEKPNDCFDMETEILTKDGWIHSKDITYNTLIANWKESKIGLHTITYSVPSAIIRREHEGSMIVINTDRLDIKVTPNHIVIVYNETFNEYVTMEAKDLKGYVSINPECYIPSTGYDTSVEKLLDVDFSKLLLTNEKSSGMLFQSYDKQTIINIVTNQRLSGSSSLIIEKEGEKGTIYQTLIGKAPLNTKGFKLFADDISVVLVNEPVWCVTVPTHRIMVKRNNSIYVIGNCHCLPDTNQVLTSTRGWVSFIDLRDGESIAQWDNGNLSFVVPSEIIRGKTSKPLLSFKNKAGFSMTLTDNHRVLVKQDRSDKYAVKLASEVYAAKAPTYSIPLLGNLNSTGIDISDTMLKLIVAVQADGSLTPCGGIRLKFSKQRKIARIRELLIDSNLSYSEGKETSDGCINFYIRKEDSKLITQWLSFSKSFNNSLIYLSKEQAYIFVNELQYWDGTLTGSKNIIYDVHDQQSRDIVQTICSINSILCTSHSYIKPNPFKPDETRVIYRATISNTFLGFGNTVNPCKVNSFIKSEVDTITDVACVTVPSGFFLCKEGDSIFVTGNSLNAIRLWGTTDKRTEAKSFSYA